MNWRATARWVTCLRNTKDSTQAGCQYKLNLSPLSLQIPGRHQPVNFSIYILIPDMVENARKLRIKIIRPLVLIKIESAPACPIRWPNSIPTLFHEFRKKTQYRPIEGVSVH